MHAIQTHSAVCAGAIKALIVSFFNSIEEQDEGFYNAYKGRCRVFIENNVYLA